MSCDTKDFVVPNLTWEPIWNWKPINLDCRDDPEVEVIDPDEAQTFWRIPVETMQIGTTYKSNGHPNISIEVVPSGSMGFTHMNLRTLTFT
jgi:hypothetical protein